MCGMTPDNTPRGGGGQDAELDFPMTIYLVKRLQLLLQGLVDSALAPTRSLEAYKIIGTTTDGTAS